MKSKDELEKYMTLCINVIMTGLQQGLFPGISQQLITASNCLQSAIYHYLHCNHPFESVKGKLKLLTTIFMKPWSDDPAYHERIFTLSRNFALTMIKNIAKLQAPNTKSRIEEATDAFSVDERLKPHLADISKILDSDTP
jgi:hypothetical protein